MSEPLLPKSGGYQKLISYQKAEAVYDLTFYFCKKYLQRGDRTIDQMIQAACSGKQNIAEGISFQSEYFSIVPGISGVFTNDKDKFDPERHQLYVNIRPGKSWKDCLANVKPEKVLANENKPQPENLIDLKSKTLDQSLSPGGMAEIRGQLLKIDETANDEGIFIISENGGGETKVSYLYENFPKTLQFEIPEGLTAGNYKIEVRNRAHKGKAVRIGILNYSLNVA